MLKFHHFIISTFHHFIISTFQHIEFGAQHFRAALSETPSWAAPEADDRMARSSWILGIFFSEKQSTMCYN